MNKKIVFDANYLITLVSKFDSINNDNLRFKDHQIIREICEYCGICWDTHVIKVSADYFGTFLNPNQMVALSTFQTNLLQFFKIFDNFVNFKPTEFRSKILLNSRTKCFEKRAVGVFQTKTRNFVQSLLEASSPVSKSTESLIENLCAGDLEKTLKIVPSRNLARQLGVSDQKLRREIYLARQRALKKRPIPKCASLSDDGIPEEFKEVDESKFEGYFDLEIPTCASPISSSSEKQQQHEDEDVEFVDDVDMQNFGIEEWSIDSLIRSDLYES